MKDSSSCVSIIVLNWNGRTFLQSCLESVQAQTYPNVESILADNGSTDDSVSFVQQRFPQVENLRLPVNFGYAEGNNRAARTARGEYLFFLNNDTRVAKDCVEKLVAYAQDNPQVGVLACRQLSYDGSQLLNEGVGYGVLGHPYGKRAFYADGASLFIRKELFVYLGGFDEGHFLVAEDVDLCWRAWLVGSQVACAREAVVYHKEGGTLPGGGVGRAGYATSVFRRYLGERNTLRNLLKNYALPTLGLVLPMCLAVSIAEFILFLALGRFDVAKAYLRAWWHTLVNLPDTMSRRREVCKMRCVSDWKILRLMEWRIGHVVGFLSLGVPRFVDKDGERD